MKYIVSNGLHNHSKWLDFFSALNSLIKKQNKLNYVTIQLRKKAIKRLVSEENKSNYIIIICVNI